jgi:hypothetical protein
MKIRPLPVIVVAAITLIAVWVAMNTEWGPVEIPSPLRGEAARNPFYAAQRLVETLGATSERRQALGDTSTDSTLVLSNWSWDINAARRADLERWVEAGGRLVVDATLISGSDAFERWSGIERVFLEFDELEEFEEGFEEDEDLLQNPEPFERCQELLEIRYEDDGTQTDLGYYQGCDFDRTSWLVTTRRLLWAMSGPDGLQAARVAVGRGEVTVVNAAPFHFRDLFDGDHGELFVAATALQIGDHVVFISEEDYGSLPELVWQHGAPVVTVLLLAIALYLWRGAMRFGPLVAPIESARRSLGEQILGTGRFAVRLGGGAALHAAAARALHEAAVRRVAGYERLSAAERVAAVARLARVDADELAPAMNRTGGMRTPELKHVVALLESARRQLISGSQWSTHGKRI